MTTISPLEKLLMHLRASGPVTIPALAYWLDVQAGLDDAATDRVIRMGVVRGLVVVDEGWVELASH